MAITDPTRIADAGAADAPARGGHAASCPRTVQVVDAPGKKPTRRLAPRRSPGLARIADTGAPMHRRTSTRRKLATHAESVDAPGEQPALSWHCGDAGSTRIADAGTADALG